MNQSQATDDSGPTVRGQYIFTVYTSLRSFVPFAEFLVDPLVILRIQKQFLGWRRRKKQRYTTASLLRR